MLAGRGIMVNWLNVPQEARQDFRGYHTDEHMVGRLGVPGFIRGRRYGAVEANRNTMVFYEMDSPMVLATEAYRELAKEPASERRRRIATSDSVRNIAAVKHSLGTGAGVGGFALTLRLNGRPEDEERLTRYLVDAPLSAVAASGGITGAHFLLSDPEASSIVPISLAGQITVGPRWIVMIEGVTRESVEAAFKDHLSSLEQHGAAGPIEPNIYQLEVVMTL